MDLYKKSLKYHAQEPVGKVNVSSPKPCHTEQELSLAYSPGVAAPCKAIAKEENKVYDYTAKGNLVGVISNGTAVLGLGNIGPWASKPVMEGKGNLFKLFAGIDVFDLELNTSSVENFISSVQALEPTFGGINLEDIKAPECFIVEEALKKSMNIPVFHDDQHGTAIITAAALMNATQLTQRKLSEIKIVINGAGAAAIACARLFTSLGVQTQQICLCDSKGVVYKGRPQGMNPYKEEFATETSKRTLAEALKGADCFVGLSIAGVLTGDMLKSMAPRPIVFAMANPEPEIDPKKAHKLRDDIIMATGRSDYPNQVNNVLGFPSIFRGALDVRARQINEEMKIAAVHALSRLAQEEVPQRVSEAYGGQSFSFGPNYIIPKPFDPRVLMWVAPAVAQAAMDSGVALKPIKNFSAYKDKLEALQGQKVSFIRSCINRAKSHIRKKRRKPRIVFPEATAQKILKAANKAQLEGIIEPILVGRRDRIQEAIERWDLQGLKKASIIEPWLSDRYESYVKQLYREKQRRGIMLKEARRLMQDTNYYATMCLHMGDADGMITGATTKYKEAAIPILRVLGVSPGQTPSGLNIILIKGKMYLFTDTTIHIDPSAQELASAATQASKVAEYFKIKPQIAMLSYTNFTSKGENPHKMKQAARLISQSHPHLVVDGEMQADTAVNPNIVKRIFPFCKISDGANILVFPNLDAGNISYKLVQQLGDGEVIGPFLMGIKKPAHIVQRTSNTDDVFNSIVLATLHCQLHALELEKERTGTQRGASKENNSLGAL